MENVTLHTPSGDREGAQIVGVGHISHTEPGLEFEADTLLVRHPAYQHDLQFYAEQTVPGTHSMVGNAAFSIERSS